MNLRIFRGLTSFPQLSRILFFSLVAVILYSCDENKSTPKEIEEIPVQLKLYRFDERLAAATTDSLPQLMQEFPYLFPKQYPIEFWENKLQDTIQIELNEEVAKAFPDFDDEMQDLENLYKHIKYYFPQTKIPKVVTVTSGVDYRNKVINADSLLIISLDTYLGPDHHFYTGIQKYYATNFRKEQIVVDAASAFVAKKIKREHNRRFLDEIILQGKRLYVMEQLLSQEPKNEIIGYTQEQLSWANENEVNIWTYFVDKELLFDTDSKLLQRFVNPAPFSKFYLEFDSESPPRLGRYIGWQIVTSYMEKTNTTLQQLAVKTADEIFENAKYKPRK